MQRIRTAIADFIRYAASTLDLLNLTERGANAIVGYRGINRRIQELVGDQEDQWTIKDAARLDDAERIAALAESEIERGFPLLHNHALMGLWGAFEAMVDDVSVNWLDARPESMTSERFPRLQVELNQFLALDPYEQKRRVVEEIKRKRAVSQRTGIGQFEGLLDAIGLGGSIDPDVRNVIRIAKGLRNVVAHKGGRSDARLIEECPDLGLKLDQPIQLTGQQMVSIAYAMSIYADEIERRQRVVSGLPIREPFRLREATASSGLSEPFKMPAFRGGESA